MVIGSPDSWYATHFHSSRITQKFVKPAVYLRNEQGPLVVTNEPCSFRDGLCNPTEWRRPPGLATGPGNAVLSFGHVPTAKNSVEFHFSSAFNCSPDLASYLRRSSTVSLRPFANASSNGVWPFTLTAFTFAPLAISSSQTSDACCSE